MKRQGSDALSPRSDRRRTGLRGPDPLTGAVPGTLRAVSAPTAGGRMG